jgi:uncharacterized membrane protein
VSALRILRHLFATGWALRRVFDDDTLRAIESAIAESERTHGGEIRFAVEANLSPAELLRGTTPRERALQAFAQMNVWDTDANNGVLIYVLWADHDVEIVADRGFNGRVGAEEWAELCHRMEAHFRTGDARRAVLEAIALAGALVARHFPSGDRDELPNRPVVL